MVVAQPVEAPRAQAHERQGDRHEREHQTPPDGLADGEPGDDQRRVHGGGAQELEEALLERRPSVRDDGLDLPAEADDGGHEAGYPVCVDALDPEPVSVHAPAPEPGERPPPTGAEASDPESHARPTAEDLLEVARGDRPPLVDHGHPVADVFGLLEQVRVQEDGRPPGAHAPNDVAHLVAANGVERAGRLVEDDQLRLPEQGHPESEPLLHPLRERPHLLVAPLGQPDRGQRPGGRGLPVRPRKPEEPAVEDEDLPGAEPALEAEELGQVADLPPRLPVAGRRPEHQRLAARRAGEPEQELDRCRLPGPVRSEESEDLPPPDLHRETLEGHRVPILLAQVERDDGGRGAGCRGRRLAPGGLSRVGGRHSGCPSCPGAPRRRARPQPGPPRPAPTRRPRGR